jgi:16S rRNA (guanine966-N2)-methyltransferase
VSRRGDVRPTSDRVREAVFSVLGDVSGAQVLDLFAGTGALGLEALSRGAAACTFVEQDRDVANDLRENIRTLEMEDRSDVVVAGFEAALARLVARADRFDLLFVDPPYTILPLIDQAVAGVLGRLLESDGLVVVEGPLTVEPRLGLPIVFSRRYGNTLISIYSEEQRFK